MKLAIDASRYGHKYATGVEWYSYFIINFLIPEIEKDDDISEVIFYVRGKTNIQEKGKVKIVEIKNKRLWTILGLSKRISKDKIDSLFVPSHTLPLILPKRKSIMIHDLAFKRFRNAYSFFQYLYLDLSTRFACKFASRILVPSIATKKDLIEFYNCDERKISVVYHGFLYEQNEISEKDLAMDSKILDVLDEDYLLFIGRIELKKNVIKIVSAFKILSKKNPNLFLVLAGKPGLGYEEILKKITEYGLMEKVVLPGYISEEEKVLLYKNANCFVFPSLYEGFGFPVLEAFFHSCPVVCAKSGSLPEVCGDACVFAERESEMDLAEKVLDVLNSSELKDKLISSGKNKLKDFSWSKTAKETLKLLK
jgi:glycosyltransferase involved in cell wall biosynthesis